LTFIHALVTCRGAANHRRIGKDLLFFPDDGLGDSPDHENRGNRMRYWEIIADNLSKAGWSWGCVATVDREGRTIFVADAHRGDGQRFIVRVDEKLTAFMELEAAIRGKWLQVTTRLIDWRTCQDNRVEARLVTSPIIIESVILTLPSRTNSLGKANRLSAQSGRIPSIAYRT
jgi:hypothetical protein